MEILDRTIAPPHYPISDPYFVKVDQRKEGGLTLYSIDAAAIDAVRIDIQFPAGTVYQSKSLQASLCNKMLLSGTTSKTSYELVKAFDELGAFTEVSLGKTQAVLTVYTLNNQVTEVLSLLNDVFHNAVFPENEFQSELNQMRQEFLVHSEKVSTMARKGFLETLFGAAHPYGKHAVLEDFDAIKLDDVRQFYKQHYSLQSCKIFVSGRVTENIRTEILEIFRSGISTDSDVFDIPEITEQSKTVYLEKEGALQSAIRIGAVFPDIHHPDYNPLKVLVTVLGGYFGSRLMSNIREDKGYTYGIGSSLQGMLGCGLFVISTEVGAEHTKDALSEIYKEIERLKTELIPNEELEKVRSYLLGQLLKAADGPLDQMDMFKSVEQYGLDQEYYVTYMSVIRSVSAEKLKELAVKYFDKTNFVEVVAGQLI